MWSLHVLPAPAWVFSGFPPVIKDMYVRVHTPVSAPEQGTGNRAGVGPRALCCDSPQLLVCIFKVFYEEGGSNAEDQFPKRINKVPS